MNNNIENLRKKADIEVLEVKNKPFAFFMISKKGTNKFDSFFTSDNVDDLCYTLIPSLKEKMKFEIGGKWGKRNTDDAIDTLYSFMGYVNEWVICGIDDSNGHMMYDEELKGLSEDDCRWSFGVYNGNPYPIIVKK